MNLLIAAHGLIVLTFTLRILLRDELSPPARMAWFVVLISLPVFGSVIYVFFGEVKLSRQERRHHEAAFAQIRARAARFMGRPADVDALIAEPYRPAFRYAASINGFHAVHGNTADLMADAAQTTARMIADIDAAQDHVHVLYYIWLEDGTGTALAEALIRAARRGVTCRAMADALGSRRLLKSPLWRRMADAGVQLAVALPLNRPLRTILTSRLDLRNHRKITVIDGRITYCGSRNSADPEFRVKAKYAPWVDIMLRFEGPVVAQNQLLFASDWMQTTGETLDRFSLSATPAQNGFAALVVGDGPLERNGSTPQLFSSLIAAARRSVTISTPYFVPDTTILETLAAAAHRGVAVTLVFPARNDSWIVAAASRSHYRRLLGAGCVIHEFRDGLLHAKTLTIDGRVALIGSSNLDLRSFDLNYENNILLQDETVTAAIAERQADYIARSGKVTLSQVNAWPAYQRIWNNVIATVGPIL
ncbi:cardiolipin synthase [Roseovarius spongiae]|uniref:Cardiolipin synthase n=1 Tax=Roseovarius spongiae TaxID=2320272 RepID=A0A3A8AW31_9RHOB|nr:cardiolipin synthase [Roseovarius spongiae]RKF15287.1 cardiolipin synthase [Roseovarius spongiae]